MLSNSLVGTLITARYQISSYQSVSPDNMLVNSVMVGDETVFADIFLRWEVGVLFKQNLPDQRCMVDLLITEVPVSDFQCLQI